MITVASATKASREGSSNKVSAENRKKQREEQHATNYRLMTAKHSRSRDSDKKKTSVDIFKRKKPEQLAKKDKVREEDASKCASIALIDQYRSETHTIND